MKNEKNYVEKRSGMIEREAKPRTSGINYVRAPKILGENFADFLNCYSALTDIVKLGTNQLTFIPEQEIKKAIQRSHDQEVLIAVGNPIMDQALSAGSKAAMEVINYAAGLGVDVMEISVIARAIDDEDLAELIEYIKNKGMKPLVECGLSFAHEPVVDGRTFAKRKKAQAKRALENGAWKILVEAEGVFENVKSGEERWDFVDDFAADFEVCDLMFEADNQDVMSYFVNAYGPKVNVLIDNSQVMQIEAARRGYGPCTLTWAKAAVFSKDGD
jgi:phosphosulfolactate synthase (CoM biosynthesis protein A)